MRGTWFLPVYVVVLSACATANAESSTAFALAGARVYQAPYQAPIEDAVILVAGGRIEAVGPRSRVEIPSTYQRYDLTGKTVTAGYFNSHVHLTTPIFLDAPRRSDLEIEGELARAFSGWGFTTIFDLASTTEISTEIDRRINSGRVKGPRVLSVAEPFYPREATPIYARPFYEAYLIPSAEVTTDEAASERAKTQIDAGADGVKLFTGSIVGESEIVHMPAETIQTLTQAARLARRPVFAHATDEEGVELAVANGVNVLAHPVPLMGPWSGEFAESLVSRGVALIPTLSLFAQHPHPATPVSTTAQQVEAFHRAGGLVLFGTDAGFSDEFDTSLELELLGRTIGWQDTLASLTTNPASFYDQGHLRGRILPGFVADLVILDADPAIDVRNLSAIRIVIKEGEIIFQGESGLRSSQ